ncbi:MAG: Ig-like domain repeat protein [Terriglobales bacterium]
MNLFARITLLITLTVILGVFASAQPYGVVVPTSVNFGQVLVGQTSPTKSVTLKNTGDSELTVSSIAISGNFGIPRNTCANGVKPGTHCNVYVTFTPTALGTEIGTLTFTDNASNSPQTVSLTGVGSNMTATKTTLTAWPTQVLAAGPASFTATVVSLGGGVIPDGEQVCFGSGTETAGCTTTQAGVAVLNTQQSGLFDDSKHSKPGGQNQQISAQYSGDQTFQPSTSQSVNVEVERWPVSGYIQQAPNPSVYCQPVTFTPIVTSGSPFAPTGSVYIFGLDHVLGVGGPYPYDGCGFAQKQAPEYYGDYYNDWGSLGWQEGVNPTPTTTTVKSSKNPSKQGQTVTFRVDVKAPWAHTCVGSVTFTSGAMTLGTVQLKDGVASVTSASLPVGQDTITVTYTPENGNFLSSSGSLVQTVQ